MDLVLNVIAILMASFQMNAMKKMVNVIASQASQEDDVINVSYQGMFWKKESVDVSFKPTLSSKNLD